MKKRNKIVLLPKMAVSNIRKNAATYLPYIGISIFAMFTYFVFDLILKNDIMMTLPKGVYAWMLVQIGFVLLGIIMVPFLYYTNSFLIKRRKKELGLYSILGLEKKHIGVMMLWESLVMYIIVAVVALGLGLVFSRLIFLVLLNLAKMPINVEFSVSPLAVTDTLLFYAFIMGLNLMVNLVQVGKAKPVELMSDSRKGEKEPRHIWIWSIIGVAALAAGYGKAVGAKLDSDIFGDFFLAVFQVVIGTYFLFTSGSICILRFLKKRKKIYYRSENFVTISGMLYRMKKSAASLSNICIFSTMVIITAVCTVALYLDMGNVVRTGINRDFEIYFYGSERIDGYRLQQEAAALADQYQVRLEEELAYNYVQIKPYKEGNLFRTRREGEDKVSDVNVCNVTMVTLEEYNLVEGVEESLMPGEVFIFSDGIDFGADSVRFDELEYTVKRELANTIMCKKIGFNALNIDYIAIFESQEQLNEACKLFGMDCNENSSYYYGFSTVGEDEQLDAFSQSLRQYLGEQAGFAKYEDNRQWIEEMEGMYGSLLFIGIFFGLIFLICLVVIMYYKQITEGFEDQKNFEVMQKVGMSDAEIRSTIKKQVRVVFGLPLAGAVLHTIIGMQMVGVLMAAIGFFETGLLAVCTAGGCLVFAIGYSLSYKKTSGAYYRIVKGMED